MGPYVHVWYFSLHALFYILFFLWTWSFSMPFSIMTSPRYYDVTHFLTDLYFTNCIAYVKLKMKDFVRENFFIFGIFIEKIMINYENRVNCPVTLHHPHPFGPPILGWVLLGKHLSHTWGYFFNTKSKKKVIVFTWICENQGQSLSSSPLWPKIRLVNS